MNYKNRIRQLRKLKRQDQRRLGNELGVSQQIISRIETNSNTMSIDLLLNIARYFNVSTDYLLGVSDIKRPFGKDYSSCDVMERYAELIAAYEKLNCSHKDVVLVLIERLADSEKGVVV